MENFSFDESEQVPTTSEVTERTSQYTAVQQNEQSKELLKVRKVKPKNSKKFSIEDENCKTYHEVIYKPKNELSSFYKEPRATQFSSKQRHVIKETLKTFIHDVSEEIYIVQRIPLQLGHHVSGNPRRKRRHEIRKQEAECKRSRKESERQRKRTLKTIMSLRTFRRLLLYTLFICLFTYQFCKHVNKVHFVSV